ncbi:hypothetical protein GGE65_001756 [Skermanella aerolata]|uniref:hypothetical protein n=1 Tax=Skermanella aerolata TaxID=393310 RepID=UPI003D1F4B41
MTYDFTRFSPQAFQALAQAIAVKVFGPGTKVFGDGPDGAREASFHGRIPGLSTHGKEWDGYGIIQAKCRQQPRQNTQDADWLVVQLKADLDKFLNPDRNL